MVFLMRYPARSRKTILPLVMLLGVQGQLLSEAGIPSQQAIRRLWKLPRTKTRDHRSSDEGQDTQST